MRIDAHNHLHQLPVHQVQAWLGSTTDPCFMVNGTTTADWSAVADLARQSPAVIPNFGLHPWWLADRPDDWISQLQNWLDLFPHAGIGECGLDFVRSDSHTDLQREILASHLNLAAENNRPITLHIVRAWEALPPLLRRRPPPPDRLLLHHFTGSTEVARQLMLYRPFFSIHPASLQPIHAKRHRCYRTLPLDRLLLETDSPGSVIAIDDLPAACQQLAQLLDLSPDHLAQQLRQNFHRLIQ